MMKLAREMARRALFCGVLFLILIEGLPSDTEFHDRLDRAIDPLVDVTGLWQFPWELFAPEVDKVVIRLSARFAYADGETAEWESPRWSEVSTGKKFRHFREITFYDRIRRDSNDELWPSYAYYLAREHGRREDGARPVKIELWRHQTLILPPGAEEGEFAEEVSERFHTEHFDGQGVVPELGGKE